MADNSFYRVLVLHEYRHGLQFLFHRNDQRRTELCRIRTISRRLSLYVRHKRSGHAFAEVMVKHVVPYGACALYKLTFNAFLFVPYL